MIADLKQDLPLIHADDTDETEHLSFLCVLSVLCGENKLTADSY